MIGETQRPLTGPQDRALEALRDLLDAATGGEGYRLDRNPDAEIAGGTPAVYEIRFVGQHFGFVGLNPDGSLELV